MSVFLEACEGHWMQSRPSLRSTKSAGRPKNCFSNPKKLAQTEEQLSQSTKILAATDEAIQTTSAEIGVLEAKIKALNLELQTTKTKQEGLNQQRSEDLAVVEDEKNQVGEAQADVAKAKANLDDKTKEERSQLHEDHPGPEKNDED